MAGLADLDLLAGAPAAAVGAVEQRLDYRPFGPGDVLLAEGDHDATFVVVTDGEVEVTRTDHAGSRIVATGGPGSIFGELSVITGEPRRATVTATTDGHVLVGGAEDLAALAALPAVGDRLVDLATQRLAEIARPLPVTLTDGRAAVLRPLVARDREALAAGMAKQSDEWRHRRFFSALKTTPALLEYLVHVDYLDHFAWVVGSREGEGFGIGRLIRLRDQPTVGEVAFGVDGAWQGRGIATLLLEALGATAAHVGIEALRAEVLYENAPMRAVLKKAGARWHHAETGVMETLIPVDAVRALVDDERWEQLDAVVAGVVEVAEIALWAAGTGVGG